MFDAKNISFDKTKQYINNQYIIEFNTSNNWALGGR